jgi:hypothetical protein
MIASDERLLSQAVQLRMVAVWHRFYNQLETSGALEPTVDVWAADRGRGAGVLRRQAIQRTSTPESPLQIHASSGFHYEEPDDAWLSSARFIPPSFGERTRRTSR